MDENKRALIVGDIGIGDLFLTRPLIQKLLENHQSVDFLLQSYNAEAVKLIPEINEVHTFNPTPGKLELKKRFEYGLKLRNYKYQSAYILLRNFKSAMIPYFANIPNRIGYRSEFRSLLLTDARKYNDNYHYAEAVAHLAYQQHEKINLAVPEIQLPQKLIDDTIAKFKLDSNNKYIVLCPGAFGLTAKLWSTNNFRQLAKILINEDYHIIILGNDSDQIMAKQIIDNSNLKNTTDLTGKTTISEAATITKLSFATISNDSALMHIAAALSVFTIGIFVSSNLHVYRPLGNKAFCTLQNNSTSSVKEVYELFKFIIANKLN